MITKRGFIAGAATAAAVAASVSWRTALTDDPQIARLAAVPFDYVVLNERYADARRFADALAEQGVPPLPIAGDAGTLWYNTLGRLVAGGRRHIAGIGAPMDLFILETLARDAGLRVRFQGHHDCRGTSTLSHSFQAQARGAQIARAVELARHEWPLALAASLPRTAAALNVRKTHVRLSTDVERSPDHPGMLISWVLA